MVNADTKEEQEANIFGEATYFLHESFGEKAKQGTLHPHDAAEMSICFILQPANSIQ